MPMIKLRVTKLYGLIPYFNMYVVDFIREAGQTRAVIITEDNKIGDYAIEDLEIDFCKYIKE